MQYNNLGTTHPTPPLAKILKQKTEKKRTITHLPIPINEEPPSPTITGRRVASARIRKPPAGFPPNLLTPVRNPAASASASAAMSTVHHAYAHAQAHAQAHSHHHHLFLLLCFEATTTSSSRQAG